MSKPNNYCEHGNDAYSYDTCIRTRLADGTWVLNQTKYSSTTTRHQHMAHHGLVGICVAGVPRGISASNLQAIGAVAPLPNTMGSRLDPAAQPGVTP